MHDVVDIFLAGIQQYVDGGLGYNNPTQLALAEMQRVSTLKDRPVGCIISLGTGNLLHHMHSNTATGLAGALLRITTDCEKVHQAMTSHFGASSNVYYRFNPDCGVGELAMNDVKVLADVQSATWSYLADRNIQQRLDQAMKALLREHESVSCSM